MHIKVFLQVFPDGKMLLLLPSPNLDTRESKQLAELISKVPHYSTEHHTIINPDSVEVFSPAMLAK